MSFTGRCHCGAVAITIPHRPDYMNDCNCSLCTTRGAHWGYFRPEQVSVAGATTSYVRSDTPTPALATHFCSVCGSTTHWSALSPSYDRMGVNMLLFPAEAAADVELRQIDGLNRDL